MDLSIQPLIDLADTDRELQIFIHSKSQLEKQIEEIFLEMKEIERNKKAP